MKTKLFTLMLMSCFIYGTVNAQTPLTKEEKDFVVKYLNETSNEMMSLVKGLSEEQVTFKPNAESWSIEECVKHIALSEANIWAGFVDAAMKTDPDPSKRSDVKMTDEQIIGFIESREQKVKTFAPFEPENKPEDLKTVLKEFKSLRADHAKWAKKTDEDLRNRYAETPFGIVDVYQAIVFMSGHTRRHVMQMKEIMESPDFPSK